MEIDYVSIISLSLGFVGSAAFFFYKSSKTVKEYKAKVDDQQEENDSYIDNAKDQLISNINSLKQSTDIVEDNKQYTSDSLSLQEKYLAQQEAREEKASKYIKKK